MAAFHVAIIGAGISGLSLALALHQQSIPCTVYEAYSSPLNTGGGLMITPNGLKVLQALGVSSAIEAKAYKFDIIYVQHGPSGKINEQIEFGNVEKYGTTAVRAYRYVVLEELLAKVQSQGIPIVFNRRFSHVTRETEGGISWRFTDGGEESASLLVGTDGIHSSVRKYIVPGIEPAYGGVLTLVAAVPTAQLDLPSKDLQDLNRVTNKHPLPSAIVVPQLGGLVIAPQTPSGDEMMISAIRHFPQELADWSTLSKDKDRLRAMFRESVEKFPQVVQNAVRNIPEEQLIAWPGYAVPRLERWTSAPSQKQQQGNGHEKTKNRHGRAVILGDAAHAIPPSAGQGVNQAFEDIYTFAGVLGRAREKYPGDDDALREALVGWQAWRQERMDIVLRLVTQMEMRRLPAAEKAGMGGAADPQTLLESMSRDNDTLFRVDYSRVLDEIMERVGVSGSK